MEENNYNEENPANEVPAETEPEVEEQRISHEIELPFLKNMVGWATFKAIIDIIVGAISCLGIITAAYGIPQIIAGVRLLNATDDLKRYISTGDTTRIGDVLFNFNKYFKLSGISIIVKIAFIIIFIILYTVIMGYVFSNMGDFFNDMPGDFRFEY